MVLSIGVILHKKSFLGDHRHSVSSFTRLDRGTLGCEDMRVEETGSRLQIPSLLGVASLTNSIYQTSRGLVEFWRCRA